MEISTSQNKLTCPTESNCNTVDSSEESGWTQYIDGFSEYNRNMKEDEVMVSSESSGDAVTGSMVSDAGSNPEWKQKLLNGLPNFQKKLNFKTKMRSQEMSVDDSLEDTASSPVNSPKVSAFL
ncbi:hypothetical protein vseg_016124 [Gypsophila vaccaria]